MAAWKIRDEEAKQLLGGISNGAFYQLKRGESKTALDQDRLVRISLLVGIFKALNTLYGPKLADAWISLPNNNRPARPACLSVTSQNRGPLDAYWCPHGIRLGETFFYGVANSGKTYPGQLRFRVRPALPGSRAVA